ncbi:MAG: 3-oxoacyl-ACP reductase family protein [Smithellaceae bacterium]|jgi:3-oxoacyl-[acyl-carrier protein] reductase
MLKGKVALITGSSRGIGKGAAIELAKSGASVVINYIADKSAAESVLKEINSGGGRACIIQADVSKPGDVERLVIESAHTFGDIDILINNAGIAKIQSFEKVSESDWDEIIRVNLKSVFLVTNAVLPTMRKRRWGRIVNISSVAAHTGGLVSPQYTASKAGIIGLTRYYANVLVRERITVNAVAPALIETDMLKNTKIDPKLIPLGRFGTIDEVVSAVMFLVQNGFVTGQTIDVNGGLYFH